MVVLSRGRQGWAVHRYPTLDGISVCGHPIWQWCKHQSPRLTRARLSIHLCILGSSAPMGWVAFLVEGQHSIKYSAPCDISIVQTCNSPMLVRRRGKTGSAEPSSLASTLNLFIPKDPPLEMKQHTGTHQNTQTNRPAIRYPVECIARPVSHDKARLAVGSDTNLPCLSGGCLHHGAPCSFCMPWYRRTCRRTRKYMVELAEPGPERPSWW